MNEVRTGFEVDVQNIILHSSYLERDVLIDIYLPPAVRENNGLSLLLINDGQDLPIMRFPDILSSLYADELIAPLFCIGIHCSTDRKFEYGTARQFHYAGFGNKAALYTQFVIDELLPYIKNRFSQFEFSDTSFAGFSLGGLSALDIVLNHSEQFINAGVFSGSLWWRSCAYENNYNDDTDRIMHAQARELSYQPNLSFFFECGALDELADRNNNGVIDSIDDTLDLISILKEKGYTSSAIKYVELSDGMHNLETWARAFPAYLQWRWGLSKTKHQL